MNDLAKTGLIQNTGSNERAVSLKSYIRCLPLYLFVSELSKQYRKSFVYYVSYTVVINGCTSPRA